MNKTKLRNSFVGMMMSATIVTTSIIGTSTAEASETSSKLNMSYLFFGTKSSYFTQVAATKGSLNVVAPNYFEISSSGNLVVTSKYDQSFIDAMHRQGIKVVPYLSNNWDRSVGRAGLANRQQLVKQIVDKINQYHLDGVDIDIEGLTEVDRANFTDFIKQLNTDVPDKEVSIAVAANPGAWKNGWQGMYDYKTLSLNSDYLMIMAYDENWEGDTTDGPVAGLPWVEKSVQYALNQGVSKDKIVLGIPFYGRIWKTDGPTAKGLKVNGIGVSHKFIDGIIQRYNGKVKYDSVQQSPKVTFTIKPTDSTITIGGVELTAGQYILWYDNQQSLTAKINLVNKYNIKGTGSWSLNQENPYMWDYFRSVLDQQSIPSETPGNDATTGSDTSPSSNETTYKVVSGDTLTKIANLYKVTVQALKDANDLKTDVIKVGQVLVIPTTIATGPTTPEPAQTQTPTPAPKPAAPKMVTKTVTKTISKTAKYKVVRGDSLSKIAKKYKVTTTQIKKDNKLKSSIIRIGQILKINYNTTVKTTVKVPASTASHVIKYKVARGDSLSKIAKKYNVSMNQIKKTNKLKSDAIKVGQILSIQK